MRLVSYAAVAAAALALASCQSVPADGTHRSVVAMEYAVQPTKAVIANRIENAVSTCWIDKDPAFTGLKFMPLAAYPDAREKGLQLLLKDPKNAERYANINILPASRENDTGHIVQVVQKGEGVAVASVLQRSISAIQRGQSPC
jgi:hypothetical protein